MADYTLACDSVLVVNPPVPDFKIKIKSPRLIQILPPNMEVIIQNPPRLIVRTSRPNTTNIVLPVAGPPGPQGPPGSGGSGSFYYEHNQILPSAGWNVIHNLGKFPNIAVILGGKTVGVAVEHVDINTVYIPFAIPVTGKVICS